MNDEDTAEAPAPPAPELLRDLFWTEIGTLTLGLVTSRARRMYLGPLVLLAFGPPQPAPGGWAWAIEGGLLARRPGGRLEFTWREGRLRGAVAGYQPSLPRLLYRLTQRPLHHLLTRLYLLRLRGALPAAGRVAPRGLRLAATGVDLGLCLGALTVVRPRRPLLALAGLVAGYHLGAWALTGTTLGGRVFGLRLAAWDGRRPTLSQALLRLVAGGRASATVSLLPDRAGGRSDLSSA